MGIFQHSFPWPHDQDSNSRHFLKDPTRTPSRLTFQLVSRGWSSQIYAASTSSLVVEKEWRVGGEILNHKREGSGATVPKCILVSKYIGSQGMLIAKALKDHRICNFEPISSKGTPQIQQFFLWNLGHVWNLGLRFMFEWKQLSATKLGEDGPFGGVLGRFFLGWTVLVLLLVGSEIPRPTTLWMFLKPCK